MKTAPPEQMSFSIEANRVFIPQSLLGQPFGKRLVEILSHNSLFKERPKKGYVLIIDLTGETPQSAFYNPHNWQKDNQKPENLNYFSCNSVILIAKHPISNDELKQLITENKKRLNLDGGEIFVYETGLNLDLADLELIQQQRQALLKNQGLIKVKISSPKRPKKNQLINEILTQARLKKIAEHHAREIDLLAPKPDDPSWKQQWRKNIIPRIIQQYQRAGFTEIDPSEIEDRLRRSTNPPVDLAKARDGWGVEAKALCGCHIKVDLNGSTIILNHCQDHPDGIPYKKTPQFLYKVGETELKTTCDKCDANLIQSVRRIKSYPNGRTSVKIDISCPHCGLISTKRDYVLTKLVSG